MHGIRNVCLIVPCAMKCMVLEMFVLLCLTLYGSDVKMMVRVMLMMVMMVVVMIVMMMLVMVVVRMVVVMRMLMVRGDHPALTFLGQSWTPRGHYRGYIPM